MPNKRKGTMSAPSPKRPRVSYDEEEQSADEFSEQPQPDSVYGQRGAFPGLDNEGDELFYGAADDGLEYLRMVRSEANSLPKLFVVSAPDKAPEDTESNKQHDSEPSRPIKAPLSVGFFSKDSAYIAPAMDLNQQNAHSPSKLKELYPDAQISYYNLLHHRFRLLRSTLRCSPPAHAIKALDDFHPITLPRNARSAHKEWRRLLLMVNPQMVQVACMDMASVLEVLEIVARMMSDVVRSDNVEHVRRIGVWAWALLGKCGEVGQLATEEVGIIRDLGKRAATILRKVQETEITQSLGTASRISATRAEGDGSEVSIIHVEESEKQEVPESAEASDCITPDVSLEQNELEAAKARLQARLQEDHITTEPVHSSDEDYLVKQTRALLDMIITVAGEFYGQRDLLREREVWV